MLWPVSRRFRGLTWGRGRILSGVGPDLAGQVGEKTMSGKRGDLSSAGWEALTWGVWRASWGLVRKGLGISGFAPAWPESAGPAVQTSGGGPGPAWWGESSLGGQCPGP